MTRPPTDDAQRLAELRELLPAAGAGIYLDTATAGPLPAETAAAMREADEWELRVGRAAAGRDEDITQREAEAQAVVAALIGADPSAVSLLPGLEAALVGGLSAVDWQAGDRVLADAANDGQALDAVRSICRLLDLDFGVAEVEADEPPSGTRLVLVPHVAPATGRRVDPAALRTTLGNEVVLAVDATCSAGALPVSVEALGADFVAFATDRWCLAPEGTAALWRGPRLHAADDIGRPLVGRLPRTALLGLARSLGWLEMYVGLEWIYDRGRRMAQRLASELSGVDGVEVVTPPDSSATIVVFRLPAAWSAEEAVEALGHSVFAIVRALPDAGAVRASVAWFNTDAELERLAAAVAELARHTPASLPRRPSLTVQ